MCVHLVVCKRERPLAWCGWECGCGNRAQLSRYELQRQLLLTGAGCSLIGSWMMLQANMARVVALWATNTAYVPVAGTHIEPRK